jgi:hypothetical protein
MRAPPPAAFLPPPSPAQRPAPRQFVRVRIRADGAVVLQTKVTTYRGGGGDGPERLDLFSVLHYADRGYYALLNRALCTYDRVYFECITDAANVSVDGGGAAAERRLRLPVAPSAKAAAEARALGLVAQMDVWDSVLPNGFVADLNTAELASLSAGSPGQISAPTAAPPPVARVVGAAFETFRLACFLLPCPEIAVLFADSLRPSAGATAVIPRSPPFFLFALVRGDLRAARKLLFAQVVEATTRERATVQVTDPAVRARNLRVLEAVQNGGGSTVAVVYGAWHSGHLASMAETELKLAYSCGAWMDAVCAETAADGRAWTRLWAMSQGEAVGTGDVPVLQLLALMSVLLTLEVTSGWDYVTGFATSIPKVLEVGTMASKEAAALSVVLYGLRHGALYFFLRRWLLYGGDDTV